MGPSCLPITSVLDYEEEAHISGGFEIYSVVLPSWKVRPEKRECTEVFASRVLLIHTGASGNFPSQVTPECLEEGVLRTVGIWTCCFSKALPTESDGDSLRSWLAIQIGKKGGR